MKDTFIAPICHEDIDILFEDQHLLVINKPSGLLSLSGKNPLNKDSVHHRIVQQYPSATMVHRLDFGTSGVMVLALNKTINSHLTHQFQDRSVQKTYTAVLRGHLENDKGCIDIPIIKYVDNFPYQKVCYTTGKTAKSHYQVIERTEQLSGKQAATSRVIFTPETGRTHQLRIHSQSIGHPIIGCDLYGDKHSLAMAKRLQLHATTLDFEHPATGEKLVFAVECPF